MLLALVLSLAAHAEVDPCTSEEIPSPPASKTPTFNLDVIADEVRAGNWPGPLYPITQESKPQKLRPTRFYDAEGNVYRRYLTDLAVELAPWSRPRFDQFWEAKGDGAASIGLVTGITPPNTTDMSPDEAWTIAICSYNKGVAQWKRQQVAESTD